MKLVKRSSLTAAIAIFFSLAVNGKAEAVQFTFTKVIDSNTSIPGSSATFSGFRAPSLSGNNIAFLANNGTSVGLYLTAGETTRAIADQNTPIPGGIGTFECLRSSDGNDGRTLSLDGENISFGCGIGDDSNTYYPALYRYTNGTLSVVADQNTLAPNSNNFSYFRGSAISGESVLFDGVVTSSNNGSPSSTRSLYLKTGETITSFFGEDCSVVGYGLVAIDGDNAASLCKFYDGFTELSRIYTITGGSANVVVDENTVPPGSNTPFTRLSDPQISGENLAFLGETNASPDQSRGIYSLINGKLHLVADGNTAIPGGNGDFGFFSFFTNFSISGENVVFAGDSGLYSDVGDRLNKVIDRGDLLDGKTIRDFNFSREGFSGNAIAFSVGFEDGSSAIYIASPTPESVPEPGSVLGLLSAGAIGAGALRRRRV